MDRFSAAVSALNESVLTEDLNEINSCIRHLNYVWCTMRNDRRFSYRPEFNYYNLFAKYRIFDLEEFSRVCEAVFSCDKFNCKFCRDNVSTLFGDFIRPNPCVRFKEDAMFVVITHKRFLALFDKFNINGVKKFLNNLKWFKVKTTKQLEKKMFWDERSY